MQKAHKSSLKNSQEFDSIIIGAGLSGLSAGVRLTQAGRKVLILESREVIGGRTSSWKEKGMQVESGLHRYLGFFEELPELLKIAGKDINEIVDFEDEIEIKMPDGEPSAVFGLSPIHKPLKSAGGLIFNNDFISPTQKAKLGVFFTHGFLRLNKNPKSLDKFTVYEYAKKHEIDEEIIARVLVPITEGLFFLPIKRYSALNLFALFAPYWNRVLKTRVGAFSGGMSEVLAGPLVKFIEKNRGVIKTKSAVTKLIIEDDKILGVSIGNKKITAKDVVMAVSLKNAQEIIKKGLKNHKWFKPFLSLKTMASVTFQLELKERSMKVDRTTFSPKTIFSAYAEQSKTTFKNTKGRLSIILAEPEKYLEKSDKEILEIVLIDAKRIGINLEKENILGYRKISWPFDFYSYEKGHYFNRPKQVTPVKGLFIAGDYTEQRYLQTMEGAVYSGRIAAEAILG